MISLSDLVTALRPHADGLASFYGGPIYLVGSALDGILTGDVDVRCVVSEKDWKRLFVSFFDPEGKEGVEQSLWRLRYEELKQSRRWSRAVGMRIDLQIQKKPTFSEYATKPRLRLDSTPEWLWRAGENSG